MGRRKDVFIVFFIVIYLKSASRPLVREDRRPFLLFLN